MRALLFYNGEDPATASASGCAAAWMVEHGVAEPDQQVMIEQGIEMKRPSRIFVRARDAMTEWLMYESVEMLLKFYAENFFSSRSGRQVRAKRGCAQSLRICNEGKSALGFGATLHASLAPIGFSSLW